MQDKKETFWELKAIAVSWLSQFYYCRRKLFIEKRLYSKEKAIRLAKLREECFDELAVREKEILAKLKSFGYLELYKQYLKEFRNILNKIISGKKLEELKKAGFSKSLISEMLLRQFERHAGYIARAISESAESPENNSIAISENMPILRHSYFLSSKKLRAYGRADIIRIEKTTVVPIKLRQTKAPKEGIWKSDKLELCAYILLAGEHFRVKAEKGIVIYSDAERELIINAFLADELKDTISSIIKTLNSSSIPEKTKNKNKCAACPLKTACNDEVLLKAELENALKLHKNCHPGIRGDKDAKKPA